VDPYFESTPNSLGLTRLQQQFDGGVEDFLAQLIAETMPRACAWSDQERRSTR
jgi:hypothetical protein